MEPVLADVLANMEEHKGYVERSLERLPDGALWERPREGVNSIGNLCLHIAGNESHYIGRCIAVTDYRRDRPAEFTTEGGLGREDLLMRLEEARQSTVKVFDSLSAEIFHQPIEADCHPEPTVLRIILHVAGHYAYHTGEIVLLTRLFQQGDERLLHWKH